MCGSRALKWPASAPAGAAAGRACMQAADDDAAGRATGQDPVDLGSPPLLHRKVGWQGWTDQRRGAMVLRAYHIDREQLTVWVR